MSSPSVLDHLNFVVLSSSSVLPNPSSLSPLPRILDPDPDIDLDDRNLDFGTAPLRTYGSGRRGWLPNLAVGASWGVSTDVEGVRVATSVSNREMKWMEEVVRATSWNRGIFEDVGGEGGGDVGGRIRGRKWLGVDISSRRLGKGKSTFRASRRRLTHLASVIESCSWRSSLPPSPFLGIRAPARSLFVPLHPLHLDNLLGKPLRSPTRSRRHPGRLRGLFPRVEGRVEEVEHLTLDPGIAIRDRRFQDASNIEGVHAS